MDYLHERMGPKRTLSEKRSHKVNGVLRYNEKLLGKNPPFDIWHDSYDRLHQPPNPEAIFDDEEEQTFEEFVEIGKRSPNVQGTGRWKRTKQRSKIALFYFGKQYSTVPTTDNGLTFNAEMLRNVRDFISVYLQIEVDFFEQFDAIDIHDQCFHLSGMDYDIKRFPPSTSKKARSCGSNAKKRKTSSNLEREYDQFGPRIDVFSLFDVLVHEAKEPYIAIVGLFDCALGESIDEKGKMYTDVLGRACGDRVACVSLPFCESLKSLLCNTIHELLHTVGFDHCNSYQCLMNAIGCEDWFFLSPVNLRKLKVFCNQPDDDNGKFLITRYQQMLSLLTSFHPAQFSQECVWIGEKLAALHALQAKHQQYVELLA